MRSLTSVPARLGAFGAVLGLSFGAAALAGGALDPVRDTRPPTHDTGHADEAADAHGAPGPEHAEGGATAEGLAVSADGIVVRRDLTGYRHLHPRMARDGTWRTTLRLPRAGVYRAYADFVAGGRKRTLATDLRVSGRFAPAGLPDPVRVAPAGDHRVTLRGDAPRAGAPGQVGYAIARAGRPVTALRPYLGARGHLVALREGDGAYLHVHPEEAAAPNGIAFAATFPSPGRYRLFLQLRPGARVLTAAHTVEVTR